MRQVIVGVLLKVFVGTFSACTLLGDSTVEVITPELDYSGTNIPERCHRQRVGGGYIHIEIWGGLTFDGIYEPCSAVSANAHSNVFRATAAIDPLLGTSDDETILVNLLVPEKQYKGVGTYHCGFEQNVSPSEGIYCAIQGTHIMHHPKDADNDLYWWMSMTKPEGLHPYDCTITIASTPEEGATGTFECLNIENTVLHGGQDNPNAGKNLNVSGHFEFISNLVADE